jgi:hypothetical protein
MKNTWFEIQENTYGRLELARISGDKDDPPQQVKCVIARMEHDEFKALLVAVYAYALKDTDIE